MQFRLLLLLVCHKKTWFRDWVTEKNFCKALLSLTRYSGAWMSADSRQMRLGHLGRWIWTWSPRFFGEFPKNYVEAGFWSQHLSEAEHWMTVPKSSRTLWVLAQQAPEKAWVSYKFSLNPAFHTIHSPSAWAFHTICFSFTLSCCQNRCEWIQQVL